MTRVKTPRVKTPRRRDLHDLIRKPVISEKATRLSEANQIVFETDVRATKPQIKKAVQEIFKVEVVSVNTLRRKGKVKRFQGREGQRKMVKKAMVRLKEGSSIDLSGGARA